MKTRLSFFAVVFFCAAASADAAMFTKSDTKTWDVPLAAFGSFWIDNALGGIDITGVEGDRIGISAVRTVYTDDRGLLDDGLEQCQVIWEGSEKVRVVRTSSRSIRVRCHIAYTIQLPRSSDLKIAGAHGDVALRNLNGNVTVKTHRSNVSLVGVSGASAIEVTNGRIRYDFTRAPLANVQATVITGNIDIFVPSDSNFEWAADSLAGDMLTTLPARGSLIGSSFRGHINAPGGPTLRTQAVMGRVALLAKGTKLADARSVRREFAQRITRPTQNFGMPMEKYQVPIVGGSFDFRHPNAIADISIGEIRGPAKIVMAAGAIDLSVVYGDCDVSTQGGPLNLGEIMGPLTAKTGAGDILVRAARLGGDISTQGGVIRVLYSGGPLGLVSGGGDIQVRQANGPVSARTPSGDISITADTNARSLRIYAQTSKGNIVLNLSSRFGADIDATIMTSDPDANAIRSDFPTLSIRKEQVNGRTRIRATGKINGGGERVELFSDSGDIRITSQAQPALTVITQPGQQQ